MHFIKDPGVWMEVNLVENFLRELSDEFGRHFVDKELTTAVGHSALELGAWGELDHVLKLGPIFNIYHKLSDILQWFVSPLHIDNIQYKYNLITCECELSSKDYPYVVEYLRSMMRHFQPINLRRKQRWSGTIIRFPFDTLRMVKCLFLLKKMK